MKVLVIGAALSGTEVSKLLVKKGYDVYLTDMKVIENKKELEALGINVFDEGHPDLLKDFDYEFIVKNPGIKYDVPFVKFFVEKGIRILNEIEVASKYVNYKYGVITGSNGKTTTTTLLAEILKKKFGENKAFACGNIGNPLSSIVLNHENEECYIALEISAFQLLACPSFKPDAAVIMNLSPDHLDYFNTLADYYNAKALVTKNMDEHCFFIRNVEDVEIMKRTNNLNANVLDISLKENKDIYVEYGRVYYRDVELFEVKDVNMVGEHNLINCMCAATIAYILGVDPETIKEVIKNFKGIEHRIEFVKEISGVKYYNDSKATNVDSGVAALKSFDKPVILLAGGHDKHTGFKEVIPYFNKVKKMYVFGETKEELKSLYKDAVVCEDLKEALTLAHIEAKVDDVVLFSPMCSSYDQFKNFEHRGEVFKELVNNL